MGGSGWCVSYPKFAQTEAKCQSTECRTCCIVRVMGEFANAEKQALNSQLGNDYVCVCVYVCIYVCTHTHTCILLFKEIGSKKYPEKSRLGPDWCGSVGWASSFKQKIAGSIPGQGTCLGHGFRLQLGCV